jgi:hypothetical protein
VKISTFNVVTTIKNRDSAHNEQLKPVPMAIETNMVTEGPPAVQPVRPFVYKPENFITLIAEKNESQDKWLDATLKNTIKLSESSEPTPTPARLASECNVERVAEDSPLRESAKFFLPYRVLYCYYS